MGVPPNITEDRVKIMIIEGLREYESKVVEPRDKRNNTLLTDLTEDVTKIKEWVQQGKGAMKLGGISVTVASFIWVVLQIVDRVHGK